MRCRLESAEQSLADDRSRPTKVVILGPERPIDAPLRGVC